MMLKCLMLYITMVPIISEAQDCDLPSTSFLIIRLENLLAAKGGEGETPTVYAQGNPHYTCQAQGTFMDTYQELSVVMNYITDTNSNPRTRQYELDCLTSGSAGWQERAGSLSDVLDGNFIDYINLSTFTNCSSCDQLANNENHCIACHGDCNDGLMRCTGPSSDECCVAFIPANKMCSPNFEFQCDGNPCGNNGTCHPSADGYTCTCPEGFTGDNCNITIDSCIGSNCDSPVDSSALNPSFNISVYHNCQSTCENETNKFNIDLCLFYCQLEEWRKVANQSGLYIPEINDQSLNDMGHSIEERWQRALSYQMQYYDAWVEFSRNQGNVISTNNKEDEDPILVWRSEIILVQESLILWRKEALSINPNLEFGELTNITAIDFEDLSYEELSQIYADISQEWSRDLNTYTVNFSF